MRAAVRRLPACLLAGALALGLSSCLQPPAADPGPGSPEPAPSVPAPASSGSGQPPASARAQAPSAGTGPPPSARTADRAAPPRPDAAGGACPPEDCVDVVVTGDVLLHPALWQQARRDGGGRLDFRPLLAGLAPHLAGAELAVCNLETPVGPPEGPWSGYPAFSVPPQIVPALRDTGYDACTTATNHALDAGTAGVERTLDALDAAGLAHAGTYRSRAEAERPVVLDAGGARVGIVTGTYALNGYVPDAPWRVDGLDPDGLAADARAARAAGADIVVAGLHAGTEYADRPNDELLRTARALAASGEVDFVYAHHTHSVLPLERHAGTWIAYGLGNSVARHATDLAVNREGLTVRLRFERGADGWTPAAPVWTAHIMGRNPARWCALPAASPCIGPAEDAASLARTTRTVNAYGADDDGARPWRRSAG